MKLGGTTVSLSSYSKHCRGHLRLEGYKGDPDSKPRCPPNRGPASEGVPHGRACGTARSRRGGRCHEADQAARRCGWLAGGARARWWRTSPFLVPTWFERRIRGGLLLGARLSFLAWWMATLQLSGFLLRSVSRRI